MADVCAICGGPIWIAHVYMTGVVWEHSISSRERPADHDAIPAETRKIHG